MEGEEGRELELDREIVSVQRANLDISTLNVKNIYIWRSIFFIKRNYFIKLTMRPIIYFHLIHLLISVYFGFQNG